MINFCIYISHMKVKIAELKANLSRHVKRVRETGESLEVCVREETVAYLTSATKGAPDSAAARETERLREQLRSAGLVWIAGSDTAIVSPPEVTTSIAGDGRIDVSTVASERKDRRW